jgi:hypothetical protein
MRTRPAHRRREFRERLSLAVFGIRNIALVNIGEAEVHALPGSVIEFVGRQVIPHPVAAVVGKP